MTSSFKHTNQVAVGDNGSLVYPDEIVYKHIMNIHQWWTLSTVAGEHFCGGVCGSTQN